MNRQSTSTGVRYRFPGPPLCRFIERLWCSASEATGHGLESVLPTGTVQLVIRLHQEPIRRLDESGQNQFEFEHGVVNGAHSRPFVKPTYRRSSVIGIHFRPAGAAAFFAEPLGPLANLHVCAELVWGAHISELREQLLEARSPSTMFDLLEAALVRRLTDPSEKQRLIQHAVRQFMAAPTAAKVRHIAEASGYRAKRFIQLFQDYVGLTPKMFCRVRRFQSVLDRICEDERANWANVALDCGYFDQSHLIRDFREFAGIRPSEYWAARLDRKNHIAAGPATIRGSRQDNFFQSVSRRIR